VDVKATKRDGAEVQVRNWNRELYRTMDLESSAQRDIALDGFRKWMLCWFKTKSVARYFEWLNNRDGRAPTEKGLVRVEGRVERRYAKKSWEYPKYTWEVRGKVRYLEWWQKCHGNRRADTTAARDALTRIGNSTWWE